MAHAVRHLVHAGCDPWHQDALLGWTPLRYLDSARGFHWRQVDLQIAEELLPEDGKTEDLRNLASYQETRYIVFIGRHHTEYESPKLLLWWLRQRTSTCRYAEVLREAVHHDLPLSTCALLRWGAAACAEARGEGGRRWWQRLAAAAFTVRRKGRCLLGGDHRAAEREAFRLAFNYGTPRLFYCFPQKLWDRTVSADGWTQLHKALAAGNLAAAQSLLEAGADVTACTSDGTQLLQCVVENYAEMDEDTQLEAFRLLLRYGVQLNCTDNEGNLAVCRAASVCGPNVLGFFLDNGIEIDTCDQMGRTLLHYAMRASVVDLLLSRGVDANVSDVDGQLPLHRAAKLGHEEAVEALLSASRLNARDRNGETALHLAVRGGHTKVVDVLLRRIDVNVHVGDKTTSCTALSSPSGSFKSKDGLLEIICESSNLSNRSATSHYPIPERTIDDSRLQIDEKNLKGRTALHVAVGNSRLIVAEILMAHGANAEALDNSLLTPLNYVFISNLGSLVITSFLKLLLEAGVDANHRYEDGKIPLHHAATVGFSEAVLLLLKHGARVDLVDSCGRTALHLAVQRRCVQEAKVLITHGADPSAKDNHQQTPLNYLFQKIPENILSHEHSQMFDLARMLLEEGADPNCLNIDGSVPLHEVSAMGDCALAKLLLEHTACLHLKDVTGRTPLHVAVSTCRVQITHLLLTHGADPLAVDNRGETPLNYLFKNVSRECSRVVPSNLTSLARMLLEAGANPEHQDAEGSTLLHCAAMQNAPSVVKLLLERRVQVDLRDARGRTALHVAAENGGVFVVNLLVSHGANPSAVDHQQRTPLNYVSPVPNESHYVGKVKLLLEAGADVNHLDSKRRSPLLQESVHAVELLLLQQGACVARKDAQGLSAIDVPTKCVRQRSKKESVALLQQKDR